MLKGGQVLEKKRSLLTLSEISQNAPVVQQANIQFGQQNKMAKEESHQQNHIDDDQYCLQNNMINTNIAFVVTVSNHCRI